MLIVQVHVQVLPDMVEAFREATLRNAQESLREPGVARFDVLQQMDESSHFLLTEVYRSEAGPAAHKQTAHYREWQKVVESMMAEPRSSLKYNNVFPGDSGWG
jgi:quinol monooxygenase YgiN